MIEPPVIYPIFVFIHLSKFLAVPISHSNRAKIEGYGTANSRWGNIDVSIELEPTRQLPNLAAAAKPKIGDWCLLPGSRALTETGEPAVPRTKAAVKNGIHPGPQGLYSKTLLPPGQRPPSCPPSPPNSEDDEAEALVASNSDRAGGRSRWAAETI